MGKKAGKADGGHTAPPKEEVAAEPDADLPKDAATPRGTKRTAKSEEESRKRDVQREYENRKLVKTADHLVKLNPKSVEAEALQLVFLCRL
jgi:hypothetical protein